MNDRGGALAIVDFDILKAIVPLFPMVLNTIVT